MPRRILTLLLLLLPLLAGPVQARVMTARIAKVSTPVATLHDVRVRLDWPADADRGQLRLEARRVIAQDLGYAFERLVWTCPLQRGWRCEGQVSSAGRAPLRLSVDLGSATTDVVLSSGRAALELHRNAASPDLTRLDLTRVPLAWSQALLAQAWSEASFTAGTLSGSLLVATPARGPLQVQGRLNLATLGLDTRDGTIAAQGVSGQLDLDYRRFPQRTLLTLDGDLDGGELLWGSGYMVLSGAPVQLSVAAVQRQAQGWEVPQLVWSDGEAMRVSGSLAFDAQTELQQADLSLTSADLAPVAARYLSGWLGQLGLGELVLDGGLDLHMVMQDGALQRLDSTLRKVSVRDPEGRFGFEGLDGSPVLSSTVPVASSLSWTSARLAGVELGAASLPLRSGSGSIGLGDPVRLPMLGGALRLEGLDLRPPAGERGLELEFGLTLQSLDVAQLAKVMEWPAFTGRLDGRVPKARYANDRLDFDGTLSAQTFGGRMEISGLAMERPFGPAPTLSADIAFEDLDLQSLTGVFGFGEITGALDGRIAGLRLVDWTAQAFDAQLRTDPDWKGRQRISQRAVQDLSSVGGAGGFGNSLQAQALKLFDDFGYRRIGISCRLANGVCEMDGLGSVGAGFSIVRGSGLPRLSVVGFNRRVDWPVLVERLVAVTQGESKPIIE